MWPSLSTQHSALSTQHSALSIFFRIECFKILFSCLLISTSFKAHSSCANGFYLTLYYSSETTALYSTKAEACNAFGVYVANKNDYTLESSIVVDSFSGYDIPDPDGQACNVTLRQRQLPQNGYTILNDIYGGAKCPANPPPTLIGYFNGVANTEINARASLDRLRNEFPSATAKPIEHELFYNQTGCTPGLLGKIDCVEDLVEVFQQYDTQFRQLLGNTGWEIFWEIMNGSYMKPGSYSLKLLSLIKFTPQRILLSNLIQRVAKSMMVRIGMHLVTLLKQPPTAADTAGHIAKLKSYADKGTGMVLVAHSQGNLFVNAAFDGIKASVPSAKAKVVHVGTAAPKLNGDYVLADIDIVINVLLRASVPLLPASNTPLTFNPVDLSGHQFEGSYLDKTRASYAKVVGMVNAALDGVR